MKRGWGEQIVALQFIIQTRRHTIKNPDLLRKNKNTVNQLYFNKNK